MTLRNADGHRVSKASANVFDVPIEPTLGVERLIHAHDEEVKPFLASSSIASPGRSLGTRVVMSILLGLFSLASAIDFAAFLTTASRLSSPRFLSQHRASGST
jgi:hypothetical protein